MDQIAVFMPESIRERFFETSHSARLAALTAPAPPIFADNVDALLAHGDVEKIRVIVTGWRSPRVTPEIKAALPKLGLIAHCAGSLRAIVDPRLFDQGVRFTSCADVNAIPVAEYILSYIFRWTKKLDWWEQAYRKDPGTYGLRDNAADIGAVSQTVGVIGASRVGRRLLSMLELTSLDTAIYDPYLSPAQASQLGAKTASLETLLRTSDIVSLNAPLLPETQGMIGRSELALMRDGALLINTARGGLIDHEALIEELRSGRINALLDVTEPEPLPPSSPLLQLPNVVVTPHVAGSLGRELHRLADATIDEVELFLTHGRLSREVNAQSWKIAS